MTYIILHNLIHVKINTFYACDTNPKISLDFKEFLFKKHKQIDVSQTIFIKV